MPQQILIVDDDAASRLIYLQILKAPGLEFQEVSDGEAALDALRADAPSLVLLDMHLPRIHGEQVLEYIYTAPHLTDTRVLVLTAHNIYRNFPLREQDRMMLKPVVPRQVREAVMLLLAITPSTSTS